METKFDGDKVKELRGRRTQHDLANALRDRGHGTTQTQVSRWESGQRPRDYILPDLAEELGVTPAELFVAAPDDAPFRPRRVA